ncbi:MAG: helix-turn-helix domain-containing protein [Cocleimonas sp.]|nr:helix-turn-helix domain-containing protein [Cocleimonas sp.]
MISNKALQSTVAKRLEILRKKRELTMSGLAERSGVSKGTLSVLEDGSGNPTISTLWNIADALEVPFSELISITPQNTKPQLNSDGISVQLIDQSNRSIRIEAYHMTIKVNSHREAAPHPSGVTEQVMVLKGHLLTGPLDDPKLVTAGEHYTFKADCPHIYSAPTDNISAIITVQYPKDKELSSEHTLVKSSPTTPKEWDELLDLLHHHSLEVTNGLPVFRLVIRTGAEPDIVARNIKARLLGAQTTHYKLPVALYFSPEKEQLCLYIFPKSKGCTYNIKKQKNSPVEEEERNTLFACCKVNDVMLDDGQLHFLKQFSTSGNLLCATLASEALSIQGIPTLPHHINDFMHQQNTLDINVNDTDKIVDKETIGVDRYNPYITLQPGYARQILVMGEMLLKYGNGHRQTLNIGTGSGLPLLMLLDIIPDLVITAIEPNPAAFAYLQTHTQNADVTLQCNDFLTIENHTKYPIITAIGASHHLNTAYLLQKAQLLLEEEGILIIADELIPSFNSEKKRNQVLINHHVSYMLDVIRIISHENFSDFSPHEDLFIKVYMQELPTIAFMATTNSINIAITHLKQLHEKIQDNESNKPKNKTLLGYYHFLELELNVLLAEINNTRRRKTSAENFFALAESSGLDLLAHHRVYATSGTSKAEGGTHVFVLKKAL